MSTQTIAPNITMELHNTCQCAFCPKCETHLWEYLEDCVNCGESFTNLESYDCCGVCWEYNTEDLKGLVENWLKDNSSDHGFYVTGDDMGWRHLSGYNIISEDELEDSPWDIVGVNSEWTQNWEFHNNHIRVIQSHHDAMGEVYIIRPIIGMDGMFD